MWTKSLPMSSGMSKLAAKVADEQSRQVIHDIIDANNCWLDFGQIGRLLVKRSSFCLPEVER
jgi:hypothetical protein